MKGIVIDLKDITDSREVMESKESPGIRWFIYILMATIIVAVALACTFEVDEYTKVTGEIKTIDAASSVISSSTSKLKEINVSEGKYVKNGEVLYVLDVDYAKERKNILNSQFEETRAELSNTELLKQSIEENINLFQNNSEDSKFYYRYEQYQNGILLTSQEIERSQQNNNLSIEEKQSSLKATEENLENKKSS